MTSQTQDAGRPDPTRDLLRSEARRVLTLAGIAHHPALEAAALVMIAELRIAAADLARQGSTLPAA